jgi:hypothetical protein
LSSRDDNYARGVDNMRVTAVMEGMEMEIMWVMDVMDVIWM